MPGNTSEEHREEVWDWESPAVPRECGSNVKTKGRKGKDREEKPSRPEAVEGQKEE